MKGWMIAALVITFLSGTSTGILIGRSITPPDKPTWKDKYIDQVRERGGVTEKEDLDRVREILDEFDVRLQEIKRQIPDDLRVRIAGLGAEYQKRIEAIIAKYGGSGRGPR